MFLRKVTQSSNECFARKLVFIVSFFFLVCIVLFVFYIFNREPKLDSPPDTSLYKQATQSIGVRVADLLSHMTLEEKVGQMALVEKNSITDVQDISTYGIGALLSGAGAKPATNSVRGWQDMVQQFSETSQTSRLGIPILYGVDAIHGHSNLENATIFPHMIGLGATGDAVLVEKIARTIATELEATGIYWSYSPTLDVPEDIRWGRTYETFSDDPALVGKLGSAYVRGLQDRDAVTASSTDTISVLSTLKHYIGLGSMEWNTSSNKNFYIDQGTTPQSETKLREIYLPPFEQAVRAGAGSVMVGLNSWGDTKLSAHEYLITDVLKGELGFTGFVVSDWYGVYEIDKSEYISAVTAINAGVDMVMLPFDYKTFIDNVASAVKKGDIPEARINDAAERILRAKFALGLFDEPRKSGASTSKVGSKEARALARETVSKSLVLLKNEDTVLPVAANVTHIRVAGSSADNVGRQSGAWTVEWQGIDGNWLPESTSILEGIRKRAGEKILIEYDPSGNFMEGQVTADLGIAVVGEAPYAEGWGDTANPTLSDSDIALIQQLKTVCKKVVVVIVAGRPLIITNHITSWDAVVMAWLPGSEGAGVADVLFGDVAFTGKLPLPWPSSIAQLPISTKGTTKDGTALLFPRYFGLQTMVLSKENKGDDTTE